MANRSRSSCTRTRKRPTAGSTVLTRTTSDTRSRRERLDPSLHAMMTTAARLSKSRFVTGCQCHKLLWWTVHEPNALELQPDKVLQDLFDQGRQVGEAARARYPGGVLIDLPHDARAGRVAATQKALDAGAPAIFEATFIADDTYAAIDVLEQLNDGYRLPEGKPSPPQKPEHTPPAAIQASAAAACGVKVRAAAVLHLNKEVRHPASGDLFVR